MLNTRGLNLSVQGPAQCGWKRVYCWAAQVYKNILKLLHCFLQKQRKASSFEKHLHNAVHLRTMFQEGSGLPSWTGVVVVSSGGEDRCLSERAHAELTSSCLRTKALNVLTVVVDEQQCLPALQGCAMDACVCNDCAAAPSTFTWCVAAESSLACAGPSSPF